MEIQRKATMKEERSGESLIIRGKHEQRNYKNHKGRSKLKSKVSTKCFHCHKEGYFKRNCPNINKW